MKSIALAFALLTAGVTSAFSQVTLVNWLFDNSVAGTGGAAGTFNTTGTAEVYDSTSKTLSTASSGVFASSSTINLSNLAGSMGGAANNNWGSFQGVTPGTTTGSAGALSVIGSGNNSHYIDITLPTLGYTGIHLSYDTRGTATGASTQTWSVVSGGSGLFSLAQTGRNTTAWSNIGFDIVGADNATSITLRLAFDGASSTSGNNRIDNILITGFAAPIPEPAEVSLVLGLSSVAMVALRRRFKARA